jgi:hypothetical protein
VVNDDRWIEIEDDFASSARHFYNAVELFKRGGFDAPGIAGYSAGMAFMHAMQTGHTSLRSYDSFLPQYADPAVIAAESLSHRILSELKAFQSIVDAPD